MESNKSPALTRWNRESVLRYQAELVGPINEILLGPISSQVIRLNYVSELESFSSNFYCISVSKRLLNHFAMCSSLRSYHPMNFSKEYFQFVYQTNFRLQEQQNEQIRQMINLIKRQNSNDFISENYKCYTTRRIDVLRNKSTVSQNSQLLLDSSRQIYLEWIQSISSNCHIQPNSKKHIHKQAEHTDSQTLIWACSSHHKKRRDYIQKELGPFLKAKKSEEKWLFSPYKPHLLNHHYKLSKIDFKEKFIYQMPCSPFSLHRKRPCEMSTQLKNLKNCEVTLKPKNPHISKDLRDNLSKFNMNGKNHHFRNFASQMKKFDYQKVHSFIRM